MIGYPLDSHVVFNDGVPEYDRAISSAPLRELYRSLYSDGVLPNVASNMQVQYVGSTRVAGTVEGDTETYNVVVNAGFGIVAGCLKLQESFYGLTMSVADTSQPRVDTVVLRLDDNDTVRSCDFHIVQGIPAANPVAPTLTRNSSVWEIGLANLYKPPVVSTSNPVVVTDTRSDPTRCGFIYSLVGAATEVVEGRLRSNVTVYVSIQGDDVSGMGTSNAPFRTITRALNSLPKNLNGFAATINIATGTYSETVYVADFFGGVVTLTGASGSNVTVTGLDIRHCNVLLGAINLTVTTGGVYVGTRAMLYVPSGSLAVSGAAEAVTLRYGAVLEVTTTLAINNASNRGLQVQYASTASVANFAGSGNAIGIYAYHSTVFVRNRTMTSVTQVINENSTISIGGAVG